jgi:hypothetical protein
MAGAHRGSGAGRRHTTSEVDADSENRCRDRDGTVRIVDDTELVTDELDMDIAARGGDVAGMNRLNT